MLYLLMVGWIVIGIAALEIVSIYEFPEDHR